MATAYSLFYSPFPLFLSYLILKIRVAEALGVCVNDLSSVPNQDYLPLRLSGQSSGDLGQGILQRPGSDCSEAC